MYHIETIQDDSFKSDLGLQQAMLGLMEPNYENPKGLLDWHIKQCNTLYLLWEAADELLGFYLIGWETLLLDNPQPAIFLGLSAAHSTPHHRGKITSLYVQCFRDAQAWEHQHHQTLILWSTTASPMIYLGACRALPDINPRPDGTFSQESAVIARVIQQKYQQPNGRHPFVLKKVATSSVYAQPYTEHLHGVAHRRQFVLFEKLGIKEAEGDRLIFIARVPQKIFLRG